MIRSLYLYIFIFIGVSIGANAQQILNKDSLIAKIDAAPNDSNKVKLYYILAGQYYRTDLNAAETYFTKGRELSNKIHYVTGILDFYAGYADVWSRKGDFNKVLQSNLEACNYAKKNAGDEATARTMLNVGLAYRQLEDYENAVNYIEQAKDKLSKMDIHKYDGKIYNLLQLVYYSMHQYRKGINAGIASVKAEESANDPDLLYAYNNLGLNYIQMRLYDSARYFLNKASALANKYGEVTVQITTALNFALIALKQQQVDNIKLYCEKALSLARKYDAHEFEGLAQYGLAYHYLLKKDYASGKLMADSALLLATRYNMRDVKQKAYAVLSGLGYAMQDGKQGYYYSDQYELLADSILNESITSSTIRTEKKFETEQKEAQIKLQRAQLRQKNTLNYLLAGSAIALLLISLLAYRNYRHRQRLQQVKIDELETEKQLTATEAVLKGEEQERSRLAKDLHDGLGGMLSGVKHSLSAVKGNLIMTTENQLAFERSLDMLDSSIKEMRRVAHNMMPEVLVNFGLNPALKDFCNAINEMGTMQIQYQSFGLEDNNIGQTTAIAVYRIIQELTGNILKHSAASSALIQVNKEGNKMYLTVEDNGKGFDTDEIKNTKGIGLSGIRYRVAFLKGTFDIQSKPGKGTSVYIEINTEL